MILWEHYLEEALREDGWPWDWTTRGALSAPSARARARILAKSPGIWAADGLFEAVETISRRIGYPAEIRPQAVGGQAFKPGDTVLEWSGPAAGILALERPALNLAGYVCGIATATRAAVDQVAAIGLKQAPRITGTRKTLPGYRDICIQGILSGGGFSHRVSLSGGVLIKENHIAAAGGVEPAIQRARQAAPHGLKLEVEVRNLEELRQALASGAEGVLVDNFPASLIREAVGIVRTAGRAVFVEVSGGITLENIADYAIDGVDVISAGFLTHSVRVVDLSLLFE